MANINIPMDASWVARTAPARPGSRLRVLMRYLRRRRSSRRAWRAFMELDERLLLDVGFEASARRTQTVAAIFLELAH